MPYERYELSARPVLLQAVLNGALERGRHPALPLSADELVRDACACVDAGADAIHLHPRDPAGQESLSGAIVDHVVREVRDACGVSVGVSTGAWIEPDVTRRLQLICEWREPDFASVNVSEDGAREVAFTLTAAGIGVEAGVWSADDARHLAESKLEVGTLTRVLVEAPSGDVGAALAAVAAIHDALDVVGILTPRLQHGEGTAAWIVLADAVARGCAVRIGLEDTQHDPDGRSAPGNAELVRAANRLLERAGGGRV